MRKNIWIWNHYATSMFFDQGGRHFWFAENLLKEELKPTIFCASTNHTSNRHIDTKNNRYTTDLVNEIPFVFVNTPKYDKNRKKRIVNMFLFYQRLFKVAQEYSIMHGKPDVIVASSVHPLTLVAGIQIAKKFGVPCICEVRDLWPESIIAYGLLKRNSILAKVMYRGEKWIYKEADSIIMTWEGGGQYIKDHGWDKHIDSKKVQHISNGIIIDSFDKNSQAYEVEDNDLENNNYKNIVYAGAISKVNNLGLLLDTAKIIKKTDDKIRFLIYGSGDEKEMLEKRCKEEGIENVIFKGLVEMNRVPSILTKSYANILHNSSTELNKYGQSQNKLFEYLAAGKCVIQTYTTGYSVLEKYKCGISATTQNPHELAKIILQVCKDEEKSKQMGQNARAAAYKFDFTNLTKKLIEVIENV